MPGQNRETVFTFKADAADLDSVDRLLDRIAEKLDKIGGLGGTVDAVSRVGFRTGGGAGGGSILTSNQFGPRGVADNPAATGGSSSTFGAVNTASLAGGPVAPLASSGFSTGLVQISAQTVVVYGQQVTLAGGSGVPAGGGAGAAPPATPTGGGSSDGASLLRSLLQGGLLGWGANMAGMAGEAALSGSMRWQQGVLGAVRGIPLVGGMLAAPMAPWLERGAMGADATESAFALGMGRPAALDNWWSMSDAARSLVSGAIKRGIKPPDDVANMLNSPAVPIGLREGVAQAWMRQRTSAYAMSTSGFEGGFSGVDALQLALAGGDYATAMELLPLTNKAELHRQGGLFGVPFFEVTPNTDLRTAIDAMARRAGTLEYRGGLSRSVMSRGAGYERQAMARGFFGQAANIRLGDIDREYGEQESVLQEQMEIATAMLKSAERSGNRAAMRAALTKYAELESSSTNLVAERQESAFSAFNTGLRGPRMQAEAAATGARAQLQIVTEAGTLDPVRMERAFDALGTSAKLLEDVARAVLEYHRSQGFSRAILDQDQAALAQASAYRQTLGVTNALTAARTYSGYATNLAGVSGGYASLEILSGKGTAGAYDLLTERSRAAGTAASVMRRYVDAAERAGWPESNPGAYLELRQGLMGAELGAEQARLSLADVVMPASLSSSMVTAEARLKRQLSSWTEPGSVLDSRRTIISGLNQQLHALELNRQKRMSSGDWDDASELRFTEAREDLRNQVFEQRRSIDEDWFSRLPAMAISAPSGSYRWKPTPAESAAALDRRGLQSRSLGFVSDRGYRAERERGYMTSGANIFDMFPGDLALAGIGRATGRGSGGAAVEAKGSTPPAGIGTALKAALGETSDSGAEIVARLDRLIAAVERLAGSPHMQPGGGPPAMGIQSMNAWLNDRSVGPQPGDPTRGRNR